MFARITNESSVRVHTNVTQLAADGSADCGGFILSLRLVTALNFAQNMLCMYAVLII
jgi:hypothetical protein